MEELIAKRYIKALKASVGVEDLTNISTLFTALAEAFKNETFVNIINNPDVSDTDKSAILLDAVKSANSVSVNNFVLLLVENGRIGIIPAIAKELHKEICRASKNYEGKIYSNGDIDVAAVEGLSTGLGKKVDASIALEFVKSDFDGIKVEVEDLGIEINFSKTRLNSQLVSHILKAI